MKALVVDDSRAMRTVLSKMLREIGFSDVAQAQHGGEGLSHLSANPDTTLALVDWTMPEMTGLEMVEAVRRQAALGGVRLMMVTTESEFAQVERAITAGADEYVLKPFTKDVIAGKLRRLGFGV